MKVKWNEDEVYGQTEIRREMVGTFYEMIPTQAKDIFEAAEIIAKTAVKKHLEIRKKEEERKVRDFLLKEYQETIKPYLSKIERTGLVHRGYKPWVCVLCNYCETATYCLYNKLEEARIN